MNGRRAMRDASVVAGLLVSLAAVGVATPALGQPLGTFDNFAGPLIDLDLWRGLESQVSISLGPVANLEFGRQIAGGRLQLGLRTAGGTGSNTDLTGEGRNGLRINAAELGDGAPSITVLQAKVTIQSASIEDCAANPNSPGTRTRAAVLGFFFNDGSGSPGVRTGDIIAGVNVERRATGDLLIAFVSRCMTPSCTFATTLRSVVFDRSWTPGQAETITVRWVAGQDKFTFTAASAAGSEKRELSYRDLHLADTLVPVQFLKELRVSNTVENCTAGPVEAVIDARFDSVKINASALD